MSHSKSDITNLPIIGSTEYVSIHNIDNVPAKIDTGADSSTIWASNIEVNEDGTLSFSLFDEKSPCYTGEIIKTKDYKVSVVRSSNGQEQIRYRTRLTVKIGGKKVKASFTLSDRSKNHFPILIGRRTISNKFLVDVSKTNVERPQINPKTKPLTEELREDPYKFHQKYINKVD